MTWSICVTESQLYLYEHLKSYLKSVIEDHYKIFNDKLLPCFNNIEEQADKAAEEFYNEAWEQPSEDGDLSVLAEAAEKAQNIGIGTYEYLKWGRYNLIATWHAMLYQLWEQQVREFLYKELSHNYSVVFKNFCGNLKQIKLVFKMHGVDLESKSCWKNIDELNLLNNVIKHGDGYSAETLKKKRPDLFMDVYSRGYRSDVLSTLLNESLNIDEKTLSDYTDNLMSFWDNLPERSFSSKDLRIDKNIEGIA